MSASYDHRATGTPERAWAASRLADVARVPAPAGVRLLVLGAHPDDETLGAGGLIHAVAASGGHVEVLVATDGEASHPRSRTHPPQRLAVVRRAEAAAALATLAPTAKLSFLGLPDGSLAAHTDRLTAQLRDHLDGPTHLITPWDGDRHPDHEACARAAATLARDKPDLVWWQYPIWAWHWADPDSCDLPWPCLRRVELGPDGAAAKRRALACYTSQHTALSPQAGDEAILSEHMIAHFRRGFETYVLPVRPDAGDPAYFDALYGATDDPWGLQSRFYERRKRELITAALPRPRFRRAFEPGCATGLLTAELAARCEVVIAWDVAEHAVLQARQRVAGQAHVRVDRGRIPQQWPDGPLDLIVLSEVGYYCQDPAELAARVDSSLTGDGVLLACHWRHPAPDHPVSSRAVHEALGAGLRPVVQHVEEDFYLDVWTRTGESVARATGVLR